MKSALWPFSVCLLGLLISNQSQAQYNAPGESSAPTYLPPTGTGASAEYALPVRTVDGIQSMSPGTPGVFDPVPAENLGRANCPDQPWLIVAPYAWIPGIKGTIASGPRSVNVDLSVRDAIQDVLPDLRGAAMLHVEGGYGDVGFISDLMYLNVRPLDGFLRVESRSTLLDLLGFYRVIDTGRCPGGCTLDVLAGARYYRFKNSITFQPIDFMPADKTNDWWDLVVGVRASVQLTESFGLFARGDYGGFDIGDSSKRACNVVVGFDWQCTDCISIYGGYRWLKIDRTHGEGMDYSKLDITLSGPFLAFGLHF